MKRREAGEKLRGECSIQEHTPVVNVRLRDVEGRFGKSDPNKPPTVATLFKTITSAGAA